MSLSDDNRAQIESGAFAAALLGEFRFTTGTQYLTTWGHDLTAMGITWSGLGQLCGVSPVQEASRLEYPAIDFTLAIPDDSILALATSHPSTYRRKMVKVWLLVMNEVMEAVDDPELIWVGLMDQITIVTGDGQNEQGGIRLRCEQYGADNRNALGLRMNHVQQNVTFRGDNFFSRMATVSGAPQPWLSKRFQRI